MTIDPMLKLFSAEQVDKTLIAYLEHPARIRAVADLLGQPEGREARWLRFQKKQLARDLGKSGEKIYALRCQLVESRRCNEIDPSAYRNMLDRLRDAERQVTELQTQLKEIDDEVATSS